MATPVTYLQTAGPNLLLTSTGVGAGNWIRVHPAVRNITTQVSMLGSSVGALVSGTVLIEVSDDGVNPISPAAGTIAFSSVASPAVSGLSIDAHYEYVRANISSYSTAASSAGGGSIPGITAIATIHDIK